MNRQMRTLKQELYKTIHRDDLSVEEIAERIGMAPGYLYRAVLPDLEESGEKSSGVAFPLKRLISLILVTKDFRVLDHIERAVGRVAIPVKKEGCGDLEGLYRESLAATAEFGDLVRKVHAATADERISLPEKEAIGRQGWQAIQAIVSVIESCRAY